MPMVSRPSQLIQHQISRAFEKAKLVTPVANARIYASILDRRWLIAEGSNSVKTHPFQARWGSDEHKIHLHAEINCIVQAVNEISDFRGCTMVVARAKKASTRGPFVWGMARPCEGCQRALAAFGISDVYYTTNTEGVIECL